MEITCFRFCNRKVTSDLSKGGHGGVLGAEAYALSSIVNVRRGSGNIGLGYSC